MFIISFCFEKKKFCFLLIQKFKTDNKKINLKLKKN